MLSKKELNFLNSLPLNISQPLLEGYQNPNFKIPSEVIEYFREQSWASKVLMANPGTFEILERVYTGQNVPKGVIDEFLFNTLSARALLYRFKAIISWLGNQINELIPQKEKINIANLGSGSGRDTIEVMSKNPSFCKSVFVKCVDLDKKALETGRELVKERGLLNFEFINTNLMNLPLRNSEDIVLLIGVLCGLESESCVVVLKRIKKYLKKGGY